MGRLELAILAGAETKAFLAQLTQIVERMEAAVGGAIKGKKAKAVDIDEDNFTETKLGRPAKRAKSVVSEDEEDEAVGAASDLDDEEGLEDSDVDVSEDELEEETPVVKTKSKKAAKAPKLTSSDVSAACKALAKHIGGENGRNHVLKILKKKFSTSSITEIDEDQYANVIAAMAIPDEE